MQSTFVLRLKITHKGLRCLFFRLTFYPILSEFILKNDKNTGTSINHYLSRILSELYQMVEFERNVS